MSTTEVEVSGSYWIVDGQELQELWASAQLGDSQHRRPYPVGLRKYVSGAVGSIGGDRFRVKLYIDGVERVRSNHHLKIEGSALLPGGLVKVCGYVAFLEGKVRGDLHTVPLKACDKCMVRDHTDRKRCDECGDLLRLVEMYLLDGVSYQHA